MDKGAIEQANVMHQYSQVLSTITTTDNFETAAQIFSSKLSQVNVKEMNPMVVESLISSILSKILILFRGSELPESTRSLVQKIKERNLMSPLFQSIFKMVFPGPSDQQPDSNNIDEEGSNDKLDNSRLNDSFNFNLDILLNLDTKADKYITKSFGYSFLDLNGDFIWCDAVSEQFFEMKTKEIYDKNFFKLMIPYSNNLLNAKFGEELFKNNPQVGSSIAFSYVIYSKKATNKFLKQLKKKGVVNATEIFNAQASKDPKALYYRYLKALSSRATLIVLKFTTAEFKDIVANKKYDVNISDSINQLLDDMGESAELFTNNKVKLEGEGQAKKIKKMDCIVPKVIRKNASQEVKDVYKLAIMLETRIAKNIPDFDYGKMADDPVIKEFEETVKNKLKSEKG